MFTTRPVLSGTYGMVATTHWLATAAGMAVLEAGGTAADAAAAAGFALHVVEPHLNGPGGDLPLIVGRAGHAEAEVLCAQGPVPAAASVTTLRDDLGLEIVPGTGPLAATVPGAFGGWIELLRTHGRLPLRTILSYAIGYAADGHPVHPRVAATIAAAGPMFRQHWPTSAERWLPAPAAGERFRQPALATTYERILAEAEAAGPHRDAQLEAAHQAWYRGFVAEAIDAFAPREWMDDSGRPHAGLLTGADLAGWRPTWEPAVTLDWRGLTVAKPAAWSQGPVLLQQLALLGDGELPPYGSAELIHRAAEGAKLAFADREAFYGDVPDVPLADLLSPAYTAARRELIEGEASWELRPGSPGGRTPVLPPYRTASEDLAGAGIGEPTMGEPTVQREGDRGDTCHVDVVDRWGTMVSATPSGGWLQSAPTIPELGFSLGTRAQMTWLQDGLPSTLRPATRPRTTLSPTLVLRDGEPVMACGTPGGDQQDQWQLCFLLAHWVGGTAGGLDLQAAIDAPAWHITSFPSSFAPRLAVPGEIVVEDRVGPEVIEELRRRGHAVTVSGGWSLGRLSAVTRDPATGVLTAAANPRGMQGYAAGR
ncbi:MAG TPA: gamma-glutamyltransferase [Mycobacteriales bacterium]|nr:gamma-glutamyltransferase [Mycobacteriales bacterium]